LLAIQSKFISEKQMNGTITTQWSQLCGHLTGPNASLTSKA